MVFLDLKFASAKVLAFNMFKHFSSPDHIVQFPYVLTAAWNWLMMMKMKSSVLHIRLRIVL